MGLFTSSLFYVLITFFFMLLVTLSGLFDNVELDIGLEHYAEIPWLSFINIMPLNTLINFGYIGLGLYWCGFADTANTHGVLKDYDTQLFYSFNIMAFVYGFVQLARIVTQRVVWAVLDQWCTLPFFAVLPIWGLFYQHGWSDRRCVIIIALSISSYAFTLVHSLGFEFALGCHILGALYGGLSAYYKHPAEGSLSSFYGALISCIGFVILKLLDLKLGSICFIFKYVSGHFVSKICDVFQIYFVNTFFFDLALQKAVALSLKDKGKWLLRAEERNIVSSRDDILHENPPVNKKAKKL